MNSVNISNNSFKIVTANRASAILYNFLKCNSFSGIFLLPSNICYIVPLTFLKAGFKIEFIDISLSSLCINTNEVMSVILNNPNKYAGILYNHTYGVEDEPEVFFQEFKKVNPKLILINDKCLSRPNFDVNNENYFCDLVLYSTGYAKQIDLNTGAWGFLKKEFLYKKIKTNYSANDYDILNSEIKTHISNNKLYKYIDSGWLENSDNLTPLSEYQTNVKLTFEKILKHKKRINDIYISSIPSEYQYEKKYQNWRFNIKINNAGNILKLIFKNELFASNHYASISSVFHHTTSKNSELIHSRTINLFNDKYINENQALKLARLLKKALN